MEFKRVWSMPSANTFDIPPIGTLVKKYLRHAKITVDPFARDKKWAMFTNDLNPNTQAQYHMEAHDFLLMLSQQGVKADVVILDPPYSPTQMKECYDGFGLKPDRPHAHKTHAWTREKNLINKILVPGGIVLSFGWNSMGMGRKHGYTILEILLVCHGAGHNDTICMAEQKIQSTIFDVMTDKTDCTATGKSGVKIYP